MAIPDLPTDFDSAMYLKLNPDVEASGIDPIRHYLRYGLVEGRQFKEESTLEKSLARFLKLRPSHKNAFDLFNGSWSTMFDGMTKGNFDGTRDTRIDWLVKHIDVGGLNILELGPLEAAHTFMLEKKGARILAVESNVGAFLRCLIVKNYLHLSAEFLLGDFEKMDFSERRQDLVIASGVLYHLKNPVEFIVRISETTKRLFIWTHYFEPEFSLWAPELRPMIASGKWDYQNPINEIVDGRAIRMIKQSYGEALGWSGFCGGTDIYSCWIFKQDLLDLLRIVGFQKIEIAFDQANHTNGPSFCVYCEKQ